MRALNEMGRVRLVALGFAIVWSVALLLGGFSLPLYSTSTEDTSAGTTTGTDTLVGANGTGAVIVLLVPLLVSLLVAAGLLAQTRLGRVAAWILTAALFGATAVAIFSIGVFVLPVPLALLVACVARPAGR